MFKAFLLTSLFLTFNAGANCIGEAQLLGSVKEVKKTLSSCRVFLAADSVINSSIVCPLDEGKVYSEGIEVGLMNGHDCRYEAGDFISGILVDNGAFVYLE